MKVFLGGTCNGSKWRNSLIEILNIDYFNPVVSDWTEDCYLKELEERKNCDYCLYVVTPKMTGVYSIAEVIDDSNKRPDKTIFCFLTTDGEDRFATAQIKSLCKVSEMVNMNGGISFGSLEDIARFLNKKPDNK